MILPSFSSRFIDTPISPRVYSQTAKEKDKRSKKGGAMKGRVLLSSLWNRVIARTLLALSLEMLHGTEG